MKAEKHYVAWTLEESKLFLNLYLDEVTRRDVKAICRSIAEEFQRTNSSIEIRVKEVAKILSGVDVEYPIVTPNMIKAVEEVMLERSISKQKMLYLFE